jgi:hypothetical protein
MILQGRRLLLYHIVKIEFLLVLLIHFLASFSLPATWT